jgi:hypothetical protein
VLPSFAAAVGVESDVPAVNICDVAQIFDFADSDDDDVFDNDVSQRLHVVFKDLVCMRVF